MKITFTHLDSRKTLKTSDWLKRTLNKRSNKSPEYHRSSKTGYGVQMMTRLTRGVQEIVEIVSRALTYTLTCSSWPKLPSSVSQ